MVCSDTENALDAQVPFIPSVEVMVKALIIISSTVLAADPSACKRIIFCAHHPCLVGSAKQNSVWRVTTVFFYEIVGSQYVVFSWCCYIH